MAMGPEFPSMRTQPSGTSCQRPPHAGSTCTITSGCGASTSSRWPWGPLKTAWGTPG
jgi:hypothetical protein